MNRLIVKVLLMLLLMQTISVSSQPVDQWKRDWPKTDFEHTTIDLQEIRSGGPGKDGIPAIDNPKFVALSQYRSADEQEPVIVVVVGNVARAYPLSVLMWHEIVNDTVGDIPMAITYCPLCNTAIVFDRRVDGRTLDFGTTGNLRHSDLVMYDRQTESWWQQYGGEAIVGKLAGTQLKVIPSRLESLADFRKRAPQGRVLVPNNPSARDYGRNPYAGYDRSRTPFLFAGSMPNGIEPMMRVIAVEDVAWTLPLLREQGEITHDDLTVSWHAGQRSALDDTRIARGRDVGNVRVRRDGEDVAYVVTFAFAFFAFHPDGLLHTLDGELHQTQ